MSFRPAIRYICLATNSSIFQSLSASLCRDSFYTTAARPKAATPKRAWYPTLLAFAAPAAGLLDAAALAEAVPVELAATEDDEAGAALLVAADSLELEAEVVAASETDVEVAAPVAVELDAVVDGEPDTTSGKVRVTPYAMHRVSENSDTTSRRSVFDTGLNTFVELTRNFIGSAKCRDQFQQTIDEVVVTANTCDVSKWASRCADCVQDGLLLEVCTI